MTEADLIATRIDALDPEMPFYREEVDVVTEMLSDADCAGDLTMLEAEKLQRKLHNVLNGIRY